MATASYGTTSAAGSTVALVGGNPSTFDSAGFSALVWKNVGKVKNIGDFGKTFDLITNSYLSQRGVEKRKGTFNAGSFKLEVDIQTDDGQALCETARDSDDDYNVKITLKNGVIYYLRGQVTEFTTHVGAPNNMVAATITFELNPFFAGSTELAFVKVEPEA